MIKTGGYYSNDIGTFIYQVLGMRGNEITIAFVDLEDLTAVRQGRHYTVHKSALQHDRKATKEETAKLQGIMMYGWCV